jgi:hypothetical protein
VCWQDLSTGVLMAFCKAQRKQFFFEKKNQKNFYSFREVSIVSAASAKQAKVFCFFFSKKKDYLASPLAAGTCR